MSLESVPDKPGRLSNAIAIVIALLATFTGVCKVKDDNIVQAMQQAQADKIDHWSWYQTLHLREEQMSGLATQLSLAQLSAPATAPATAQDAYAKALAETNDKLAHLRSHKEEMSDSAKADQAKYDALNYRDDQFDLSDVLLGLAIALLAITALVQKRWLFGLALVPAALGVLMGLSGLLGWHVHPDGIIALLS